MERIPAEGVLDWLVARIEPDPPDQEFDAFVEEMTSSLKSIGRLSQPIVVASAGGLDGVGWDDSLWILNAMRETDELPADITWAHADQVRRRRAWRRWLAGSDRLPRVLDEYLDWLGLEEPARARIEEPVGGWKRVPWRDLGRRLDIEVDRCQGYPADTWFKYESWPVNIDGPEEGSLDREQFLRLVDHLVAVSPRGGDEQCFAYYGYLRAIETEEDVVYRGRLGDLHTFLESDDVDGTPTNIWPADRSWLVYTDYDLWGTKVSGCAYLIERLTADSELETVRLAEGRH